MKYYFKSLKAVNPQSYINGGITQQHNSSFKK